MNLGLRACLVAVGAVLVGVASLCYEDEEQKIQSRIEDYWVRLSDMERPAYNAHQWLSKHILELSDRILNSLFGSKYISWQFASMSISVSSIAALLLLLAGKIVELRVLTVCTTVATIGFLMLLARNGTRGGWHSKVTALLALPILLLCVAFASSWNDHFQLLNPLRMLLMNDLVYAAFAYVPAVVVSFAGDVVAIWTFRKLSAQGFRAWFGIWGGIFGAIIAALSTLFLPAVLVIGAWVFIGGLGSLAFSVFLPPAIISMDIADFLLLGAVFVIAVTIALHHLVWPFMLRTLYSFQRLGFSRIRLASWSIGLALVGSGIAPSLDLKSIWEMIGKQLGL